MLGFYTRLVGASDAELAFCLKNCLPSDVIDTLAPDCKTETAILAELRRQYGGKDRVINHILEDVANLQNPLSDPLKCADFYRAILSALNDLNDLDSSECLTNPAFIAQLVRKLPPSAREKWWEMLYPIDGDAIADKDKPAKFVYFVRWQPNISDEMVALKESVSKPSFQF